MPVVITRSKRYKKSAEKAIHEAVAPEKAVDVLKTFAPTKTNRYLVLKRPQK